jgi:thiamine-monophosphate kinase
VAGGEDYELLFTARPEDEGRVEAVAAELGLALTSIGRITDALGITLRDETGTSAALPRSLFEHFSGCGRGD